MKLDVIKLDGGKAGSVDVSEAIFGLEKRADILHRVITWQLAKRRAGTHAVQFRSDISGTTKRRGRQKGGGTARHGSGKVSQFRSGGRAFGPIPRDHGFKLPKKVRALGLKTALSTKQADQKLIIVDDFAVKAAKTQEMADKLAKLGLSNALFIDGAEVNADFAKSVRNLPNIDVLPTQGANVYDIIRRDTLVLSKAAIEKLEERLS